MLSQTGWGRPEYPVRITALEFIELAERAGQDGVSILAAEIIDWLRTDHGLEPGRWTVDPISPPTPDTK
jgi:hypothetical protein